jgi:hypothetical protein
VRGCPRTARRQPAGQDEHGGDLAAAGRRDHAAIGVAQILETVQPAERFGQAADRLRQPAFQGRDQVVQGVVVGQAPKTDRWMVRGPGLNDGEGWEERPRSLNGFNRTDRSSPVPGSIDRATRRWRRPCRKGARKAA